MQKLALNLVLGFIIGYLKKFIPIRYKKRKRKKEKMKNKKIIRKIAFTCVFIFAILGAFTIWALLHEMSHRSDFKEIASSESSIYLYRFSMNFDKWKSAYFEFIPEDKNIIETEEFKKLEENTENKAITVSLLTLPLFIYIFVIFVKERREIKKTRIIGTFKYFD